MPDSLPPGYTEQTFSEGTETSDVPGLAPKAARGRSMNTSSLPSGKTLTDAGVQLGTGVAAQIGLEAAGVPAPLAAGGANVASDVADRIMARIRGQSRPPLTNNAMGRYANATGDPSAEALSAIQGEAGNFMVGMGAGILPKVLSRATGIGAAKDVATDAYNAASKEGESLASQKAGVFPKLKQQFKGNVEKGLESNREGAATTQAQAIMDRMLNKTPAAAAAERAAPEEVLAPKVAEAKRTYFDSLDEIRKARQAPYEKAMEPIKDKPVADMAGLQKVVGDIRGTQGLNIRSTELKSAFDRIENSSGSGFTDAERKGLAKSMTNEQIAKMEAKAELTGGSNEPLTYGELWRLRNDAWRTIKSSTDPEERAAAHQFTDEVDKVFEKEAPVAQADKDRYALYKSGFTPKLTRDIAKARTPGEVGNAIFSQPESVTLQVIDQAKKSPAALERLQGSFADAVREKSVPADNVVARTNPAVLRGLYGDAAKPLIKLGGPEMNVKAASWARMIQSSPEGRAAFKQTMSEVMDKEGMKEAQTALREGTQAVGILPKEQQAAVNAAVAKAGTIQQKLAILQKALPDPKSAAVEALKQGPGYNHWQRWALHHAAFMSLGALGGASGYASGNKELEYAGLGMFLLPVATQTLLSRPMLAKPFVEALDLPPTRFGLKKMATATARMVATQAVAQAGDALTDTPEPTAPAAPAALVPRTEIGRRP